MIYSAKQPLTHLIFSKPVTIPPCSPSQLQAWGRTRDTDADGCTWPGAPSSFAQIPIAAILKMQKPGFQKL